MIKKEVLSVKGMDCVSCANVITKTLQKSSGVDSIAINFATNQAHLTYDPQTTSIPKLNKLLSHLGYSLTATQITSAVPPKNFILTLFSFSVFTLVFMTYELLTDYFSFLPKVPFSLDAHKLFFFLLATAILIAQGKKYIFAIFRFVRFGVSNMDTLVGLSAFSAYLYSAFVYLLPKISSGLHLTNNLYFDVPIVIIGFIAFGKYLESNSQQKTNEAIKKLLALTPQTAVVERKGKEIEINTENVLVGDIIIVKPGAIIPVDGIISFGTSSVNESTINGEPLPVDKTVNDRVFSSTINLQGFLKFKADKVGSNTVFAQIIKIVEEAQNSKAPIQELADQISSVFIPVVLVIATLSLIAWSIMGNFSLAISSFIGVLAVACPCALGLATPTAIIVGVGKGAQNGILIKDATTLQKLQSVSSIVFDKTGTLTTGEPVVTDTDSYSNLSTPDILKYAASLEKQSEHPLAIAVLKAVKEKLYSVTKFDSLPGKGIKGDIENQTFYLGNVRYINSLKLKFNHQKLADRTNEGKTPIILANKKEVLGAIFIADTLKPETLQTVNALHKLNLQVVMLTGDDQNTANFIGKLANIDQIFAEVLPGEKANKVQEIIDQGKIVAMVGDGVNDAPALTVADVGISMSTGSDVAIESAGVTLLNGDLNKVAQSIKLSRYTLRTIKQNLFWAFFYNVLAIPIAAGILFPFFRIIINPAIAGAAMAFSSVSVITNSLRLRSVKL